MNSNHVTVAYSWTAQPGKLDEPKKIYAEVTAQMKAATAEMGLPTDFATSMARFQS